MKSLFALLAILPTANALASLPTDVSDEPTAIVRYDDLNLRDPVGAAALRRRIDRKVVSLSGG